MKIIKSIRDNAALIRQYIIVGIILGTIYGSIEYIARSDSLYPQAYFPLIIRANLAAFFITISAAVFEIFLKDHFLQKTFIYLVLVHSIFYTFIISFWLAIINGFWGIINQKISFSEGMSAYLFNRSHFINLLFIFLLLVVFMGLRQINSLHRRGELLKFIVGKYHRPKELNRIFCFIDIKSSTSIAEQLGHYQFSLFLKDYYSDITDAIRNTNAEIYQYVGDEIVLTWSIANGMKNNNMLNCFFEMKKLIDVQKPKYLKRYGVYPEFKAGIHSGKVIVTWVGEIKKQIVYIGDVLNTTARIQEASKRLSKEFLISGDLLEQVKHMEGFKATFEDETVLRGKKKGIKLFSLTLINS